MKKLRITLSILMVAALIVFAATGTASASGADKACCTVYFTVMHSDGTPATNCMVHISGPAGDDCMTDEFGRCKMCVGEKMKLTVGTCCGGTATFKSCEETNVTIICP
jgi:hypothetical protein